jgi:UPF0716 protein FxsA
MAWMVLLAVITLPVVEIALFVKSSQWIGVLPTVALAIAAGVAGIAMVRAQGLGTLARVRTQLDRGEAPLAEAFDAICLGVAGGLLLLPGFFSDVIALLLLLPPVRAGLRLWLAGHLHAVVVNNAADESGRPSPPGQPPVIEGDFKVIHRDDDQLRG